MIARIWHGWTSKSNSDKYEKLLIEEIFQNIRNRNIKGYFGIELLKRETGDEIEFITIMKFKDVESIKEFAGEKYEVAVVPERAKQLLRRYDQSSQHYEVIQ